MIDLCVAVFGTITWMGTLAIIWLLRQYDSAGNLRNLRLYFLLNWIGWTIVLIIQMLSIVTRTSDQASEVIWQWTNLFWWIFHEEISMSFAFVFMPIQAAATGLLLRALLSPRVISITPVPVAQVTIDLRGIIVDWNDAAEHLLGWSAAEVIGEPIAPIIIPEEYRQAHLEGMERFRQTGAAPLLNKSYPVIALCKEGQGTPTQKRLVLDLNLTSRHDPDGMQYFVGQLTQRTPLV